MTEALLSRAWNVFRSLIKHRGVIYSKRFLWAQEAALSAVPHLGRLRGPATSNCGGAGKPEEPKIIESSPAGCTQWLTKKNKRA